MSEVHKNKCPISHPERYRFSNSHTPINDEAIIIFYEFCRRYGFRGIVMWHMYNEPALEIEHIRRLMEKMRKIDRMQAFQLTTHLPGDYRDFDIVNINNYSKGSYLDNRIKSADGTGLPYSEMPKTGRCGRGLGWEIPIDYYGNWCLCCNDWRCEESFGSIMHSSFLSLLSRYIEKRKTIRWYDEESYYNLPRMCRSCLDVNPHLSKRGGI